MKYVYASFGKLNNFLILYVSVVIGYVEAKENVIEKSSDYPV